MNINCGIEIDYQPDSEDFNNKTLKRTEFDYYLCSVHFLKNKHIEHSEELFSKAVNEEGGIKEYYNLYYRYIQSMVKWGKFDTIAHFDLLKKFNLNNRYFSEDEEEYNELIEKTLDLIEKKDKIVEVSSKGIYKCPVHQQFCKDHS